MRPTWAEIDLGAFDRNVDAIVSGLPEGTRLIAMLKANGYGHGAVALARRCTPDRVAMIGVALLEEALELRDAGITLPILVVGPLGESQITMALDHDVTLGVPGPEELELVAEVAKDRDVAIHLKLDSGMGRMGAIETELPRVAEILRSAPRLRLEALYTHFANASDPRDPFTTMQLARFETLVETLREAGISAPNHHVANSAATARGITPGDYVRTGISLYGADAIDQGAGGRGQEAGENDASTLAASSSAPRALRPAPSRPASSRPAPSRPASSRPAPSRSAPSRPAPCHPLLRWRTAIVRLKELPAGSAIGYGTTFHTARPSLIATLPVGYADGYDRRLSNLAEVLVRGRRAPVVGRVSMDLVTIDVTDIPEITLGDEVVLLGRQGDDEIRAEELAAKLDTISYEILCRVGARVPRIYVNP